MTQSDAMLKWAGDDWFQRNKGDLGKKDLVGDLIDSVDLIKPDDHVLEIGCANGWRLKKLTDKYGCQVAGVDPSMAACKEAWDTFKIPVSQTTASNLPYAYDFFDIVIMGFCMWLTEPKEWLRNVSESDRVLKDGGFLIIQDFCSPRPLKRPYPHASGIDQYFYDWPKLWLAHPAYQAIDETVIMSSPTYESVTLLSKSIVSACG